MTLDHSGDQLIAATPSVPNLSDGEEHRVKIWYLPAFATHPGTVTIFIDNMDRPALVGEITMRPLGASKTVATDWEILNKRGGGYAGFVGANNDAPQDMTLTYWSWCRFPGCVGY
jgi:hypothetical protein